MKTDAQKLRDVADWINLFNKKFPDLVLDSEKVEADLRSMAIKFDVLDSKPVTTNELFYLHKHGKKLL